MQGIPIAAVVTLRETVVTTASVASCRDTVRRCIPLHPLPAVVSQREKVHTTASVASCRDTPPTPHPELSCPWDSMEAATFPPHALHGTAWRLPDISTRYPWDSMEAATFPPHALSTPVLRDGSPHQTSLIRTDTTLPFSTYQNRPKLCWLEACRGHHQTRRDEVSSQTEGNSVRVVEAVHKVDRFSHKIVQVHQLGKTP